VRYRSAVRDELAVLPVIAAGRVVVDHLAASDRTPIGLNANLLRGALEVAGGLLLGHEMDPSAGRDKQDGEEQRTRETNHAASESTGRAKRSRPQPSMRATTAGIRVAAVCHRPCSDDPKRPQL